MGSLFGEIRRRSCLEDGDTSSSAKSTLSKKGEELFSPPLLELLKPEKAFEDLKRLLSRFNGSYCAGAWLGAHGFAGAHGLAGAVSPPSVGGGVSVPSIDWLSGAVVSGGGVDSSFSPQPANANAKLKSTIPTHEKIFLSILSHLLSQISGKRVKPKNFIA